MQNCKGMSEKWFVNEKLMEDVDMILIISKSGSFKFFMPETSLHVNIFSLHDYVCIKQGDLKLMTLWQQASLTLSTTDKCG